MSFCFDKKKAQEVVLFLAHSLGGSVDISRLYLLLYKADVRHLAEHGTLITGDTYIAMNYGPVPYEIQAMLKQRSGSPVKKGDKILFSEQGEKPAIVVTSGYDASALATSEVQCIFNILRELKTKKFEELSALAKDAAWSSADNGEISIPEMAASGGASTEMLSYIEATHRFEMKYFSKYTV